MVIKGSFFPNTEIPFRYGRGFVTVIINIRDYTAPMSGMTLNSA
jgi:hypothetical protein